MSLYMYIPWHAAVWVRLRRGYNPRECYNGFERHVQDEDKGNGQQRVLAWVEVGSRWLSCGSYSSAGSGREQPRARQRTREASRAVPNSASRNLS